MNRRKKHIYLIVALIAIEITLIKSVPILESYKHPLLSSLTCIETEDIRDLYWNINQIELSGSISETDGSMKVTLSNNVPNFNVYLFRTNDNEKWKMATNGVLNLKLGKGENIFEVKAKNMFGVETPAVKYRIIKTADAFKVTPKGERIIKGRYDFHFETYDTPKIEWLRNHTLPVVARYRNQWEKYISLRKWVREQIPFKYPSIKSHWDAQRILQTVWEDSEVGFECGEYAATYTSACISVGLNARMIHLESVDGRGHCATEIWSDDYNKWIFMDPLFDCYFTIDGVLLSTIELHNLWKTDGWSKVVKRRGHENTSINTYIPEKKYFSLFHDTQLISANDFLSNPFTSVLDLLTMKIKYIRWIDESNPKYNKASLATKIILYYYLPKISRICIIPVFLPFLIILISILFLRETHISS